MTSPDLPVSVPIPDLEARAITMEEYQGYAPEKFELIDGYLFLPGEYPELRLQLLKLLLVNVGAARSGETGAGATVAGGAGTGVRPDVIAGLLGGSRERAAGSRLATLRR